MEPCGLMKAALSLASFSLLVGRMPLSLETDLPLPERGREREGEERREGGRGKEGGREGERERERDDIKEGEGKIGERASGRVV